MRDEQKYANIVDMVTDYNNDKSLILDLTQRIAELEEQLKNAIVPKFKIGQKVWFIYGKSIRSFIILRTDIEIRDCVLITYSDRGWYQFEENCFATKEEAQAKLEELRG